VSQELDPVALDALLDRIPSTSRRPREVVDLPGGLTNHNLKVTTPDGTVVVRMFASGGELLAIDRENEYANSVAAALAGVGAPVVDYLPADNVLVVGWLEGRTYTDADLADPSNLPLVAAACRALHSGPRFVNDFDMFAIQAGYLAIVREHGFRLPDRYLDLAPQAERVRRALAVRPAPTVPCNNDLLAGNFVDDGERLWLIDYEYSGNNDACFELGNIWSEAALPLDHLDALVTAYYGRPRPSKVARARLLGWMSKYGWTLWASIQAGTSTLDFDFWSWGMEKYERALVEVDGPDFDAVLDAAAVDD
jgi:thiamine kinase-like enzyme